MRNNVAGGDEARLAYIWAWLAHMIQKPTERPGVALVLRGAEGSGKTKVGEVVGSLLGPHYFLVDDPRYLVGQFNAFMAHCLLLQCDEGFWAGDKPSEGRLKGLITSSIQMIEHKGIDPIPMRNLVRLMVTSNEGWVVPAGPQARRFAVFDVGEAARLNAEYFAGIDAEMAAGGREALLGFLQRFDLSSVNLRDIPATSALSQQKIASMTPEAGWWFEVLLRGAPTRRMDSWDEVITDDFYGDYIAYCDKLGVRRRAAPENLRILVQPSCRARSSASACADRSRRSTRAVASPNGARSYVMSTACPTSRNAGAFSPSASACRPTIGARMPWRQRGRGFVTSS